MAIVCSLLVLNNLSPWQERLLSPAFLQPPWHDRHPARLAIEADLPSDSMSLARAIDSLVDRLSLRSLVASYRGRGSTPHRPDLLLKAVLFLVQRGKHYPADWHFQAHENRVVQWLLRGSRPSRARWYAFRRRLVGLIDDLNRQLLNLARQQGHLDVQVPILDGTLLGANSTRHKLLNQAALLRRLLQLEQAIAADEAADAPGELAALESGPAEGRDVPSRPVAAVLAIQTPLDVAQPEAADGANRAVATPRAAVPSPTPAAEPVAAPTNSAVLPIAAVEPASTPAPAAAVEPASKALVAPVGAAGREVLPLPRPVKPAPAATGATARPGWMAQTATGRLEQRQHYHKVQQELNKRLEHNAKRRKEDRKPPEKVYISPGDPEASMGLDKMRVYRPLYNGQVACDLDSDFYLAYGIFSGVPDAATLLPMLLRLHYFLPGVEIDWLMTDAGYANGANLRTLEQEEVVLLAPWQENDWTKDNKKNKKIPKSEFVWNEQEQTYRCPEGHVLSYERTQTKKREDRVEKHQQYRCAAEHCLGCVRQGECTSRPQSGRMVVRNEYEEEVLRHKQRMETGEAKELYRKRKEQVERRLADSKQHRDLRQLSMRGKDGAHVQLGLVVLASNLVTFDKLDREDQDATPDASWP